MPSSWCTSWGITCVCMPALISKHTTQTSDPLGSSETNPSSCCRLLGVKYCHLPNDNGYTTSVSCNQCFRVNQLSQKVQHKGAPNLSKGLCIHLQALKLSLIIPHLKLHRGINPYFHYSSQINEKFFHQYLNSNFRPTLTCFTSNQDTNQLCLVCACASFIARSRGMAQKCSESTDAHVLLLGS